VAFKAIYPDRLIAVAALTKAISPSQHIIVAQAGMALDTALEANGIVAYTFVHRFIALVQQQMHVVFAHPLRILDALPALSDVELGHQRIRCPYRHGGKQQGQ
jgi:hypothetical protein